jgi:hypothetical protein
MEKPVRRRAHECLRTYTHKHVQNRQEIRINFTRMYVKTARVSALFVWLISHQPTVLFSQNKPTITNQPAVLFSQNKPAPASSHQQNEHSEVD